MGVGKKKTKQNQMEPAYRILNVHAWSIDGLSCGTDITLKSCWIE